MAQQLFEVLGGFSDGTVHYLSGAGAPGGAGGYPDTAPVGSTYSDSVSGTTYKKMTAGATTANWIPQANITDLAGLSAIQSWREPALVRENTFTTIALALADLNASGVVDGIVPVAGDRVLYTAINAGAGANVYIVGGTTGAFTLVEDVNNESTGDTLEVRSGTAGGQIWLYDTNWKWIGQRFAGEDAFMQAYIGKAASGGIMPAYSSTGYVVQGSDIATAISALDAQATAEALSSAANATQMGLLQAEVDVTQAASGLSATGAYIPDAAATYIAAASTLHAATQALDTALAGVQGSVTTNTSTIATNAANIATNATDIAANALAISNAATANAASQVAMQAELDATQAGSGLSPLGAYVPTAAATYISAATTLDNATVLLDAHVAANAAAILTVQGLVGTGVSGVQAELDTTQTGAGLGVLGAYVVDAAAAYINTASSIHNATQLLDAQASTQASALAAEVIRATAAEGANATLIGTQVAGNYYLATDNAAQAVFKVDAQVAANTANLAAEVLRATAAEGTNAAAIGAMDAIVGVALATGSYFAANATHTVAITALDVQVAANAAAIVATDSAAVLLASRVTANEGNITSLQSQMVTAQSDIVINAAAIAALQLALAASIPRATVVASAATATVVDSVLTTASEVAEWDVSLTSTANAADCESFKVRGGHNGRGGADATVADSTRYGRLRFGAGVAGITYSIALSGTGAAQAMDLTITVAGGATIKVARYTV